MQQYRRLQILGALVGVYVLPYRYFLVVIPLLLLPDLIARSFGMAFPGSVTLSRDRTASTTRGLAKLVWLILLLLVLSGVINGVPVAAIALSVLAYGFPLTALSQFEDVSASHARYFFRANAVFVYAQIPFLIGQWAGARQLTDDWFRGTAMEPQNTQIVAFIFFVNTWLYLWLYRKTGKYGVTAVISVVLAVATNTHLQTVAFFLSGLAYVALRRSVTIAAFGGVALAAAVAAAPLALDILAATGSAGLRFQVSLALAQPQLALEVGKIRGVLFGVQHLADSALQFLMGLGPATIASRTMLYKLESAATALEFLGPLSPLFEDFTRGLFLPSNLHRPWSNASAFLLEGGAAFTVVVLLLLAKFRRLLWQSAEGKAVFLFLCMCLFIEHVMDNAKMMFFLVAGALCVHTLTRRAASRAMV